jgi:predicted RNA-binding Zn-ribbon protein involved in translation (DUF1610 family)
MILIEFTCPNCGRHLITVAASPPVTGSTNRREVVELECGADERGVGCGWKGLLPSSQGVPVSA